MKKSVSFFVAIAFLAVQPMADLDSASSVLIVIPSDKLAPESIPLKSSKEPKPIKPQRSISPKKELVGTSILLLILSNTAFGQDAPTTAAEASIFSAKFFAAVSIVAVTAIAIVIFRKKIKSYLRQQYKTFLRNLAEMILETERELEEQGGKKPRSWTTRVIRRMVGLPDTDREPRPSSAKLKVLAEKTIPSHPLAHPAGIIPLEIAL